MPFRSVFPLPSRTGRAVACLALLVGLTLAGNATASIAFKDAGNGVVESPEGKHLLHWDLNDEEPTATAAFELQYANSADFSNPVTRYRGRDTATSITGLVEGEHHYRIRLVDGETVGEWSEPLTIRIRYVGRGIGSP